MVGASSLFRIFKADIALGNLIKLWVLAQIRLVVDKVLNQVLIFKPSKGFNKILRAGVAMVGDGLIHHTDIIHVE